MVYRGIYTILLHPDTMPEFFDRIVSKETVDTFGIDMYLWGADEDCQLREAMLLVCKENPNWSEEQATEVCKVEVDRILFAWFKKTLGHLVLSTQYWPSLTAAYTEFRNTTLKQFIKTLGEQKEFKEFADEFYSDLRELWNIGSVGLWDEFQRMKKEGMSFSQYRASLNKKR